MVYRNKEGYADPTAGAAIHEAEPKAKKKEYNPEAVSYTHLRAHETGA